LGNRTLRLAVVDAHGALTQVFAHETLTEDASYLDALEAHAIMVVQRPFNGQDAEFVLTEAIRNAWPTQVGPHSAALVWADPESETVRSFGLYWADGPREWIARAAGDPNVLIDMARSIYCIE
jgi:hypothetical protein